MFITYATESRLFGVEAKDIKASLETFRSDHKVISTKSEAALCFDAYINRVKDQDNKNWIIAYLENPDTPTKFFSPKEVMITTSSESRPQICK